MDYRIEIFWKADIPEGRASNLLADIHRQLGIEAVRAVRIRDLYFLRGDLSEEDVQRLCEQLLVDAVVQGYRWQPLNVPPPPPPDGVWVIEVGLHPGVTDSVADHLARGAHTVGVHKLQQAVTATRYELSGDLDEASVRRIAEELLCNDVIQSYALGPLQPAFVPEAAPSDAVETIPIRNVDDETLMRMSVERVLYLSLDEMQIIRAYYRAVARDPTDVELETLAQTWSEHCIHKTFKAHIRLTCRGGMPRFLPNGCVRIPPYTEEIDDLFASTIRTTTKLLAMPWVRSAFVDNAGVIAFDDEHDVSFKVETHNHPSALEPFGGANTGVGGVVRDIIGVSARPIATTDVLCFGPQDLPTEALPPGVLHPRRIAAGVIAGIEDYGNKMGIPTVNGAILYDEGYTANPLVFCGCVGIAPRDSHPHAPIPNDLVVVIGGRTGRDGLHGATFSSATLAPETAETVGSVVQIGDPITEKALLEVVMIARDEGLYTAITDCGAGGFSSAVGEMGRYTGVDVELADVPLKYPGLRPWEIWLSEAQERMVLAVPPKNLERLRALCERFDVPLMVIGRFCNDGRLIVRYRGQVIAQLEMNFLHEGIPRRHLTALWDPPQVTTHPPPTDVDVEATLLQLLALPDTATKENVVRRYDHEVQGGTVIKPFVGPAHDGPSDAVVLRPLGIEGTQGIALGCGINPHYGKRDPYAMAWAVVEEALRNVVAVGANPNRVALLDNFCWGDPSLPDRLGGLVRAAQGCHDAALAYWTPFISGKDSLNNEYVDREGRRVPVPPTLLISAIGLVEDVRRAVTMDLKQAGHLLYVLGWTYAELGGSAWYRLLGRDDGELPAPMPESIRTMRALHQAMKEGLVAACHDCSEGGLAVALAEMAFAGRLGASVSLAELPRDARVDTDAVALFAETNGRFVVEVPAEHAARFEQIVQEIPFAQVGQVTDEPILRLHGLDGGQLAALPLAQLGDAWQGEGRR